MDTIRTDPNLIALIKNQDNHEAWSEFEGWYAPIIQSFCISRGMLRQDADDISQEVFLRLSQSPISSQYDPTIGRFRSYLFQVTRSAVSSVARQNPRVQSIELSPEQPCIEEWNAAWDKECVRRAISSVERTVSEHSKQILNLSMRGTAPAVIAETLGVSAESVYKARQRLQTKIQTTIQRIQFET